MNTKDKQKVKKKSQERKLDHVLFVPQEETGLKKERKTHKYKTTIIISSQY